MGLDVASLFERMKHRWIFFIQLVQWRLLGGKKKTQNRRLCAAGYLLDLEKGSCDVMFMQKRCKNNDRNRRIYWIIARNELVNSLLGQVC